MKKLKKLMLSLFMGISILSLSACGGGEESSSELKVALGGQITSLDPALADDTYSMIVIQNMYRTLFKLDEEGKLVRIFVKTIKSVRMERPTHLLLRMQNGVMGKQ